MKRIYFVLFALLIVQTSLAQDNPILKLGEPGFLYVADPAAEVYNGKVYVYCSHDQPDAKNYRSMQDYVVLESSDLKTWINHGVVLKPREFSWAHGQMNAPDAAYKDGWYYYYFPFDRIHVGVVKSRNPEGPWEEAVTAEIAHVFDPTVFVDDDGQAYIYGNHIDIEDETKACIYGAKLKDNMLELDGGWHRLSEEVVNEAVHLFKREGKYYFTARKGKATAYFMADNPLPTPDNGGYAKYKGNITANPGGAPAHNSFIEFKGQWYIFYQRGDVNEGTRHRRSACFDKIDFNADGTIKPVVSTLGKQ